MSVLNIFIKYYKSLSVFLIILIVSILPTNNIHSEQLFDIPHLDKIAHFGLYFLLTFTIFYDLNKNHPIHNSKMMFIIIIILSFYGGMIELIQIFIPGRSGDFTDFLFDVGGIIFGVVFFLVIKKVFNVEMKRHR